MTSEPIWQFQNRDSWTPGLNFSASDGPNLGIPRLAAPGTIHGVDFTSQDQSLHEIIPQGTEEQISNLLASGVSVNTRDSVNNSPLHAAILSGNFGIIKSLLNYGADIDAVGFRQKTPLHLSIVSKELVQLLLKHQPKLSLQDDEGNSVLHCLLHIQAWWKDLDIRAIIKMVLYSGANVNMMNNSGETPLHRLVTDLIPESDEYLDILSEFLNYKPNVTSPMHNGLSLMAVFLDKIDILSKDEWSSGNYVKTGFRCLEQFLNAGADLNIIFRSTPLLDYFLENGQIREYGASGSFIKLLLQKSAIDLARPNGNYPLHLALSRPTRWTSFPTYDIAAALVSRKANVNQTNAAGASPLEIWLDRGGWGRSRNFVKVALLLVKGGAATTRLTSTGGSLFDSLTHLPNADRICLTRAFLEADINSQQDDDDIARLEWVGVWRSTWEQPVWQHAKAGLAKLIDIYSRPKIKEFHNCAFVVTAEHLLERHRSRLELWRAGNLDKESVRENYEEYRAILRDCRDRQAEIKLSWYTYLLDIMD